MNWGTKLVIGMALFMGFILTMSVKMIFSDKDDLVEKDYYEKGLNYDQDYQRKQNVAHDEAAPEIEFSPEGLKLQFKAPVKGAAKFAHPSDKNLDWTMPINSNENTSVVVPTAGLQEGQWHLTLTWESKGKKYLFEKVVYLP